MLIFWSLEKWFMKNGSFKNFWFLGSRNWFVIHKSRTHNSYYYFGCVQPGTPNTQSTQNKKIAYLCNISRKVWWGGGGEVDFLLANKHGSFLQADSITFGLLIQACPKYLKQKSYNIFVISQGKCEGWTWSLPTDKRQRLLQIAVIILGVCGQA